MRISRTSPAVANDFFARAIASDAIDAAAALRKRIDQPVAQRHDAGVFQPVRPTHEVIGRR
jgi:hypothetical protein